jgi:hypothetical protein
LFVPFTGRGESETFSGFEFYRKNLIPTPNIPMRTKSPITSLLQRLTLSTVFLFACYAGKVSAQHRPFVNISSRAQVLNGQNVMIAGFTITSTATTTKQVLIRGMGPSTGIPGYLADPTLTLNGPNGVIYTNNNWGDTQYSAIAATGMQPGNALESAILWTLPPGSYTVTLAGNNGGTGVGLVEVYDMGGACPMVNLSSRAQVGTGDNVLIGGLYVLDTTRAVVRAIGPSLANYGIQGALANPMLELYNAQGAQIASNDNWGSDSAASEIQRLGFAPSNGLESAILPTLNPGPYTVIVKGVSNGTGVGVVDMYALEDAAYPRIFQAWGEAEVPNEERNLTAARHDLFWTVDFGFGWNWVNGSGQATQDYTREIISFTEPNPIYSIPTLRGYNPNIKLLVQVTLVSLAGDRLPLEHAWWKRGAGTYPNNRVPAPGGGYLLDLANTTLQDHVANQARALMQTGQFDGVMLDSLTSVTSSLRFPILQKVRIAIGGNGLIIVNANSTMLGASELGQVNGVFMETGIPDTGGGYPTWQQVKTALDYNEANVRNPKVNCLETWFVTSRTSVNDMKRMRATTCLSLTHSGGYALFSDPNSLPAIDHLHNWYDFWPNHNVGAPNLGFPIGTYTTMPGNYADRREFKNGTAIWNAATNTPITVTFPEMRKSLKTQLVSTQHTLYGIDGDIYLINY